jgi:ABC transporter substrate binding protein (PQQ-dependent alcohol dehydrogenase system)
LLLKSWKHWLVVTGADDIDKAYLAALTRTAKRFGATIVDVRPWTFTRDSRHVAGQEVASITQGAHYDVLVTADESNSFGDQIPYATWEPRPIVGTQGLVAAGWHPAYDSWGAEQLQNRFRTQFNRPMSEKDFAAWEAGRAVGEAAIRSRSTDPQKLITTIKAPDFGFAAYKGRTLSFRPWDGQLRQPIALAWARSVVSMAPEEGFMHPETDLDTLGYDKGEVKCASK